MDKTFALISLGCAKNLVNSEQMLYLLDEAGYTLTPERKVRIWPLSTPAALSTPPRAKPSTRFWRWQSSKKKVNWAG